MKPTQRRIRDNISRGQTSYGAAVQLASPDIVEIIGYTGFDFAWIDAEHGALDLSDIRELIRAADGARVDSIVRVPNQEPTFISRCLDLGATGIMAPHVSSVAEGKSVVAAAHYGPAGTRGACPCGRAYGHQAQDPKAEYRQADQDVLTFGIIETVAGVENVEAISRECGFDGLLFGPFDLSIELGLEGDIHHPKVAAMRKRVVQAIRSAGLELFSPNAQWEPDLAGAGAGIIAVLGDRDMMVVEFQRRLAATKDQLKQNQLVAAK